MRNKSFHWRYVILKYILDACQFHPGGPIFHDALKGWSCCNKKSTDFTQFLNIPGCTRSFHSNEKPPEPEKPPKDESAAEVIVYQAPRPQELTARPTSDENIIELPRHVQPSLIESLLKAAQNAANTANNTTQSSNLWVFINGCLKNIFRVVKIHIFNSI